MLDPGNVITKAEIASIEGLTPARITQIVNLLKLPGEVKEILIGLSNPKDVRKYSVSSRTSLDNIGKSNKNEIIYRNFLFDISLLSIICSIAEIKSSTRSSMIHDFGFT